MSSIIRSKYLITGGCGQLGGVLAKYLRAVKGPDNVILSDIKNPSPEIVKNGPYVKLDVTDAMSVKKFVVENKIDSIIHLAALLSATAEVKLKEAFDLNVHMLSHLFILAKANNLQIFVPSTIAAFGPDSPLDPTPDICIQRPTSLYGVSKVYCERLGEYFHTVHGVDFRSLRYPGIISATKPGGGTTDYAVDVFFKAIPTRSYECYLEKNTKLPFAYIDDAIQNTVKFILAPSNSLKQRVYNYGAFSITPEQLFDCIKKNCIKDLKVSYKIDPLRQKLANSWPKTFDFSCAVKDWDLKNVYNLEKMVCKVHEELKNMKI